jgi:alkylation response protein AidB-like acyl-CoA dehydrogenase
MTISREELRDAARKALGGDGLAPDATRSWEQLVEMGWFALTLPEDRDGLGLGAEALAAVHIELGRALVPGAAMGQMIAIEALAAAPDFSGRDDILAAAVAGERIALSLDLQRENADSCVADADLAKRIMLLSEDRIMLAPLASSTPRPTWDCGRRLFDVTITEPTIIATGADAGRIHRQAQASLLLALSADSIGGAEAALEMTVEYLKTRRQFDRPLALFQALKHRVADMRIAVSAAEALLWNRAGRATGELTDLAALKALATSTYLAVAEEAIQLHGGIGLTVEHPCHLFLKRAFLNAALGGSADHWNELVGKAAVQRMVG